MYDATFVLAHGLDFAIKASGGTLDFSDGTTIMNHIIDDVSFEGASGLVDLFEGM
jgi:hypothetical protein